MSTTLPRQPPSSKLHCCYGTRLCHATAEYFSWISGPRSCNRRVLSKHPNLYYCYPDVHLQVAERGSSMELVAPLSGTQLWADVWAVPAGARVGGAGEGPRMAMDTFTGHGDASEHEFVVVVMDPPAGQQRVFCVLK